MFPVEVDGCSLVIVRERGGLLGGYDVLESGWLCFDGEMLELEHQDGSRREIADGELGQVMNVAPNSRIGECAGFRLFILRTY